MKNHRSAYGIIAALVAIFAFDVYAAVHARNAYTETSAPLINMAAGNDVNSATTILIP